MANHGTKDLYYRTILAPCSQPETGRNARTIAFPTYITAGKTVDLSAYQR